MANPHFELEISNSAIAGLLNAKIQQLAFTCGNPPIDQVGNEMGPNQFLTNIFISGVSPARGDENDTHLKVPVPGVDIEWNLLMDELVLSTNGYSSLETLALQQGKTYSPPFNMSPVPSDSHSISPFWEDPVPKTFLLVDVASLLAFSDTDLFVTGLNPLHRQSSTDFLGTQNGSPLASNVEPLTVAGTAPLLFEIAVSPIVIDDPVTNDNVPFFVKDGLITTVRGSNKVIGIDTHFDDSWIGQFLFLGPDFYSASRYPIIGIESPTEMTLETSVSESNTDWYDRGNGAATDWRIVPRKQAYSGAVHIDLNYIAIDAPLATADQRDRAKAIKDQLQAPGPNGKSLLGFDLELASQLPIPSGRIVNVAITTGCWRNPAGYSSCPRASYDVQTIPPLVPPPGIKIAFDVDTAIYHAADPTFEASSDQIKKYEQFSKDDLAAQVEAYRAFLTAAPTFVIDDHDWKWALSVSDQFLKEFLADKFETPPSVTVPDQWPVDVSGETGITRHQNNAFAIFKGNPSNALSSTSGGLVDATGTLDFYIKQLPNNVTALGLQVCVSAELSSKGTVVEYLTGEAADFILGFGLGTDLANSYIQDTATKQLTSPFVACNPNPPPNCNDCWKPLDIGFDAAPGMPVKLLLQSVWGINNMIVLGGDVSPDFSNLRPASMSDLRVYPWTHMATPCGSVSPDPIARVMFSNDGDYPLRICHIDQDIVHGRFKGEVLAVLPHPDVVNPGQTVSFSVVARITGDPSYSPTTPSPLLLRVRTTAGAREVDLNRVGLTIAKSKGQSQAFQPPATSLDAATLGTLQALSNFLCAAQHESVVPGLIWRAQTYTDPLAGDPLGLSQFAGQLAEIAQPVARYERRGNIGAEASSRVADKEVIGVIGTTETRGYH